MANLVKAAALFALAARLPTATQAFASGSVGKCRTTGGTARGPSACHFPFVYGGRTYKACVPGKHPWCFTGPGSNAPWGDCIRPTSAACNQRVMVNRGDSGPGWQVGAGGCGWVLRPRCPECTGDCDNDRDCAAGLTCYQRNGRGRVPGCSPGGAGDVNGYDYCTPKNLMFNKGGSGCTARRKCSICEGDCDRDTDCKHGLKCFQRNGKYRANRSVRFGLGWLGLPRAFHVTGKTAVHGCSAGGAGDVSNYDFCYNPSTSKSKPSVQP